MKNIFLALILLLTLGFTSCTSPKISKTETASSEQTVNQPSAGYSSVQSQPKLLVPDFTLTDRSGKEISLSDYQGKKVVLNFWASWCPPCKAEMPDFQNMHKAYAKEGDVVFLMINQTFGRETKSKADQYIDNNKFTFPVLYDYGSVGNDIFGISSYPTTVVVDTKGYISNYVLGMTNAATVKRMINEAE